MMVKVAATQPKILIKKKKKKKDVLNQKQDC